VSKWEERVGVDGRFTSGACPERKIGDEKRKGVWENVGVGEC
jgi:hypothetical protein